MSSDVTIRPLRAEDIPDADLATWSSLRSMFPEEMVPDEAVRAPRGQKRIAHLLQTDPGGCWVAERDGRVIGAALGLIREDLWGFSLFGLLPEHQGAGVGTRLFAPALAYGEHCRGGIILSSTNPAAMRRYFRAGFALRPSVTLAGVLDRRAIPSGLRARPGDLERDRETCDRASRHVRGAAHGPDIPLLAAGDNQLLVRDGEGFAVVRDDSVALLAATNEAAARDLLWSGFAATKPGATVHVDFITAENQWAIDVALRARLALSPDGPVFTRGDVGPMAPYRPSGAYL